MTTWKDPIVEEVRSIRDAYAKRFGYDLKKIGADLMKKQNARAKSKKSGKAGSATKTRTAKKRKAA